MDELVMYQKHIVNHIGGSIRFPQTRLICLLNETWHIPLTWKSVTSKLAIGYCHLSIFHDTTAMNSHTEPSA